MSYLTNTICSADFAYVYVFLLELIRLVTVNRAMVGFICLFIFSHPQPIIIKCIILIIYILQAGY